MSFVSPSLANYFYIFYLFYSTPNLRRISIRKKKLFITLHVTLNSKTDRKFSTTVTKGITINFILLGNNKKL